MTIVSGKFHKIVAYISLMYIQSHKHAHAHTNTYIAVMAAMVAYWRTLNYMAYISGT